jgi:hypothetical protein
MRPSLLTSFLANAFKNKMQVLIKGSPGIGKSDIIDQAVASIGAEGMTKHPSIEDVTDARGLPGHGEIDGVKVAQFYPFDDLYRLIVAPKLLVCHLEDFGQACPAVQAGYMQLLLRRSVNGHRLSDNVVFVASTNDVKDSAGVGGLLEPVKSRFHTIIPLEISVDDWVNWAIDHNLPAWLIAYIRSVPDALNEFKPTKQLTNSPCPRTWAAVGKWDSLGVADIEVWSGAVGKGRAAEAFAYREAALAMPDPDACLLSPDTAPIPDQPSMRYAMAIAIAYRVNERNFAQAIRYTGRIGKPFEVLCVKDAWRRNPELVNTQSFVRWAVAPENKDTAM